MNKLFDANLKKPIYTNEEIIKYIKTENFKTTTKPKTKNSEKIMYYEIPAAFDIETSSFLDDGKERGTMYIWQLGFNGLVIIGRTWKEFKTILTTFKRILGLAENKRLVLYVHNLNFEYQFIKKQLKFIDTFETDNRQILRAITTEGIEFRCSYALSNEKLEKVSDDLQTYKIKKMIGNLDYKKIRNSKTPLTDDELLYCINDVKVVMAYIQEKIDRGEKISTIPLTRTGYVRRMCKNRTIKGEAGEAYRNIIRNLKLDYKDYIMCRNSFCGGGIHANPIYVGKTIRNVYSIDETSCYLAVAVGEKLPMSSPEHIEIKDMKEFDKIRKYRSMIFEIEFTNIKLKQGLFFPPIQLNKCSYIYNEVIDNGRVEEAEKLGITITNIDYEIFEKFYTWGKIKIGECISFYNSYLPTQLVDCILEMYERKTNLKGVKGKETDYLLAKGDANSIYGMFATTPTRGENEEEELNNYNKKIDRFLFYPWAVFITAHARERLFTGIYNVGKDFVYSDTDSVKFLHFNNHREYIDKFNRWNYKKLKNAMKYHGFEEKRIEPLGKILGEWTIEEKSDKFKTLRGKAYINEIGGDLKITIAGVAKNAVEYFKKQKNPFTFFKNGFEIPAEFTGKLTHKYIDEETHGVITDYLGNTTIYEEKSSIYLIPSTYKFSYTTDYEEFLELINGIIKNEI